MADHSQPDPALLLRYPQKDKMRRLSDSSLREYLFAGIFVALVTLISLLVEPFTGYVSIALLYLLLVVGVGLKLTRGPVLTVAGTSALLWNFLFIPPHLTIYIEKAHDLMMFAMFFIVAMAMGHLTSRLRSAEIAMRRREARTAALYELTHQAAFATDLDTGLRAGLSLIKSLFGAQAALLLRLQDHTLSKLPHPASSLILSEKEQSAAALAFRRRAAAGKFTDTLPNSEALHLPLQGRTAVMGVLSISAPADRGFDSNDKDLLEAFAVLIGLILEKDHFLAAIKRAEILEASERLRRTLLDSVSHELKTPLAAVQTGIDALAKQIGADQTKQAILREIRSALQRQHRVVKNLLDMTRIEAGVIQPNMEWCDIEELIHAAIGLAGEAIARHEIVIAADEAQPMVKIDQALIEESLCNLLVNAASWSKPGSAITVCAALKEANLMLSVLDEGPGFSDADHEHIFKKFFRSSNAPPGGSGLGLSIVEGFVRAHGGTVLAATRAAGGAEITLTIPVETMSEESVEDLA